MPVVRKAAPASKPKTVAGPAVKSKARVVRARPASPVKPVIQKTVVQEADDDAVARPLSPGAPEAKKSSSGKRKRLSKAFSRPLDKKLKKSSPVRDRITFPAAEYEQLVLLKQRFLEQGLSIKKSQLVRAGLLLLGALDDEEIKELLVKVPAVD